MSSLTQDQYSDLQRYVPESDMVKMVYNDLHDTIVNADKWSGAIEELALKALSGDSEALLNLLELTYLNAHNEGLLDGATFPEEY